jgi:transposase
LVKLVGRELGIEVELDRKGNLKNIKAMASRRTFLQDPTHRIRFVYTPKHTSWLNQIELWFSILVRKVLKRSSFTSVEDLHQRILEYIEYFNRAVWPNHSNGGTRAVRCRSKAMDYFHRDALVPSEDRGRTATVLQPGWYTPVRNGHRIVSDALKTL